MHRGGTSINGFIAIFVIAIVIVVVTGIGVRIGIGDCNSVMEDIFF